MILIALAFLVLTLWTWRKWPDILVDFGRELYVPWQLSTGKVLYRDIAYFNGPLSPYFNAFMFRLFGVSLTTIIFVNLGIAAAITMLIFIIVREFYDQWTAIFSCLAFLTVSAFGHLGGIGNYNFVCPYSHEMTHGVFLALAAILFLQRFSVQRRAIWLRLSGLALGLTFLTKAEIFLAALAAIAVGLALMKGPRTLEGTKAPLVLLLTSAVPILISFAYLGMEMPWGQALHSIAGTWAPLLGSEVSHLKFYRVGMGVDRPWTNVWLMLRDTLGAALVLSALVLAAFLSRFRGRPRIGGLAVLTSLILSAVLIKGFPFENHAQSAGPEFHFTVGSLSGTLLPWLMMGRILSLLCLTVLTGVVYTIVSGRDERLSIRKRWGQAVWATFSLVLLGKMILNVRLVQYGFALAMPAMILLVATLVSVVPEWLERHFGRGQQFRRLVSWFLLADIIFFVFCSGIFYTKKTLPVGEGGDRILAFSSSTEWRGEAVKDLLQELRTVPVNASLLVLPEGVMINYLSRRTNPTPFINFMPPEMLMYGEIHILDSIKRCSPDIIVLSDRDTTEYGVGVFGADPKYGSEIMSWVRSHYQRIWEVYGQSGVPGGLGMMILRHTENGSESNVHAVCRSTVNG